MIYLKTDDEALARELLIGFNDRAVVNVGSSTFVICDIARNLSSAGDVSVEAKGERVVTLPWDVAGLPPVGTVCEMHIDGGKWVFGTVAVHIYLDRPVAVAHNGEDVFHGYAGDFRPIRTPEQIATEEREAAIDEMWRVYWQPGTPTAKQALGLLWDAGYRKQSKKQDDQQ